MRYLGARLNRYRRETIYRSYVTDTIQMIAQSTGRYPTVHYMDLIQNKPTDNRTGDEIIADLIKVGALVVTE